MAAVLLLVASSASAGSVVPQQPNPLTLTFTSALLQALTRGPQRESVEASRLGSARVAHAARQWLPSPPEIEVAAGARRVDSTTDFAWEATLGVYQELSIAGLGESRRRFAEAYSEEQRARQRVMGYDVQRSAASAWLDLALWEKLETLRAQAVTDARLLVQLAAARVREGAAPPADLPNARGELGRAQVALTQAQLERGEAESRLAYLVGAPDGTALRTAGAPSWSTPGRSAAATSSASRSHPLVLAAAAEARRLAAQAALAESEAQAGPVLGPSVTREGTGDWLFLMNVRFPVPVVRPGALQASQTLADAALARARHQRAAEGLDRRTAGAKRRLQLARERCSRLRNELTRSAREAVELTEARYREGAIEMSEVLWARTRLRDTEERCAQSHRDVLQLEVELAWLTNGFPKERP